MQFILIAHDRADGLALRQQVRPQHLAYLTTIADQVVFGGPMLDNAGRPCGSTIVYEAATREAVEALVAADPYSHANLFDRIEINGFRTVVRDGVITA